MTYAPNKRYDPNRTPIFNNVQYNIELNIPALEINTDRSLLSATDPIKMKRPARMRSEDLNGNPLSSALDSHLIGSDFNETSERQGHGLNLFVSAKYNRRTSSHSVTFTLPESDTTDEKKFNNKVVFTGKETNGEYCTSDEEINEKGYFDALAFRRMSAPELPPISTNGKSSNLVNNGFLTSRSNTFHNYRFNQESKKNRKSIHSDSSLNGYGLTTQSRTSSSSSQKSRGRVLSAGTERRPHGQIVPELENLTEIPPSGRKKIENTSKKTGMPTMVVPPRCASVNVIRRANSKLSLVNQSQKMATPRGSTLKHSNSEGHLGRGQNDATQFFKQSDSSKKSIKRISSDKSLTEQKNVKNSTNGYTRPTHAQKGTQKSVNGIKKVMTSSKLSSKASLKADDKKSDSGSLERLELDSDSDNDRDRRVHDWIIGTEDAEPPEEPQIDYVDEPPQRDTAIRIVYEGDS